MATAGFAAATTGAFSEAGFAAAFGAAAFVAAALVAGFAAAFGAATSARMAAQRDRPPRGTR